MVSCVGSWFGVILCSFLIRLWVMGMCGGGLGLEFVVYFEYVVWVGLGGVM